MNQTLWCFMPFKQNQLAFSWHCLNSIHCQKQILWLGLDNANSKFVKNKWRLRVLLRRNYWKTIKIKRKKMWQKQGPNHAVLHRNLCASVVYFIFFFCLYAFSCSSFNSHLWFFFAICHAYSWASKSGFSDKAQQLMQLQRIVKKKKDIA